MDFSGYQGSVNEYGIPMMAQNSFDNAKNGGQSFDNYIKMLSQVQGLVQPKEQQSAPLQFAPVAPIQSGPVESSANLYRQPTYLKKGLLG